MTASHAVTATFTPTHALMVTVTGSGTVTSSPAGIVCPNDCAENYLDGTVVTLASTPAAGWVFTGWTGDCGGTSTCTLSMMATRSVTATFTRTHALTVAVTGSGTVTSAPAGITCPIDCTENYIDGTTVTLTPTPAAGWVFTAWTGDCTGTGTCTVSMTASRMVTATFTQTYTLTVAVTGSGTVASAPVGISCPSDCTESYLSGTTVTLTPTPAAGWVFTDWSGDCTGTETCTVSMTAAHTVTATFTQTYTLTVAVTGSGTVTSAPVGITCPSDCTESYLSGTTVTLTPTPAAGWEFTGWTGACTGTGDCKLTMKGDRAVTASFTRQVWLAFGVHFSGGGLLRADPPGVECRAGDSCRAAYEPGTTVTLRAIPDSGWRLDRWVGPCDGQGVLCTLDMTTDDSVVAFFTPLPDLTVSATVASSYTAAQANVQIPVTVTRAGGNLTEGTYVTARLYWSSDATWDVSDLKLWESNGGTPDFPNAVLNSANSLPVTATVIIPDAGPGPAYILAAVDPANSHSESNESNNVTAYAVRIPWPNLLTFAFQPSDVPSEKGCFAAGFPICPPVDVEVRDLAGNAVTSYSDPICLELGTNPGSGTLTGGGCTVPTNGVARFYLSIDAVGAGYTVVARSGSLTSVTSAPFDITIPGDLNRDGRVGYMDLCLLTSDWTGTDSTLTCQPRDTVNLVRSDINKDGRVNMGDMIVVAQNWTSDGTGQPAVVTGTASQVSTTSATLRGTVNPNGLATSVWFEWGADPALADAVRTTEQSIGSGKSDQPVSAEVSTLSPGMIYYYRVVAQNCARTDPVRGEIQSLETPPLPDLTITATVATAYSPGQTAVAIPVTVTRTGGSLTQGTYVTARLYWSSDATWDASDVQMWESNGGTPDFPNAVLNLWGADTVTATVGIPAVPAGFYNVLAVVDPTSFHSEINESNNVTAYPVTLAPPLPTHGGIVWTGNAGNGLWGDPGNWDKDRVPSPADTAYITLDGAVVTLDVSATVRALEVTGSGARLTHNANTLQVDSSATFGPSATYALGASDALKSGTLSGAGNVLIQGTFEWTGGRQRGTGTTTLASGAQVTWTGLEKHLDGRTMVSYASVEWSLGNFVLWNAAHFINNATLTWVGTGSGTLFPAIDDGLGVIGTVTNNGILRNTTSATLQVYVTFNHAGSVAVERGTIHFIRGGTHTGAFTVAAGAALVFAWTTSYPVATNTISGSVSGAGVVQFGNIVTFETGSSCRVGGLVVSREATTLNGTLEVADSIWVDAGGVLQLETPATAIAVPRLMLGGRLGGSGVIRGSDSLIVTDSFVWTGGTLAGHGVTWIRNTATGSWRSSPKTLDERTLINDAATTDWSLGTLTLANGASLVNTGVIDQTASLTTDLVAGTGGGTFTNTGTFRKSGSSSMSIAVRFDNRSVLEILAGTITLPGDYGPTASSALAIGLGGTTVGTQYGRLAVQGVASLGGTLNRSLIGGFTPVLNDQFTVLTFGTRSGDFASVNLPSLPGGLAWQPSFTPTSMTFWVVGAATTARR